ncbi:hypothetical protein AArcMg_1361 [Natrarchaeobaculum sulfurireducens]|uniref:Pilin/flagellin n=1 Tax=Natrarchaeobaculum sulfurireducens TaxID=2044521 RepID=A0A346PPD1_9EURY|nr:hypothetical protein AArcMg_1361 [Natrarchaeobaculum sulfurireducens]
MSGADADRGVSEVIAFVLVFGIIFGSVALISVTGLQAMESYQENEQLQNAERAMGALADNFNDVMRYDGIEERYGELALQGGGVGTGSDGTQLNITVDGEPLDSSSYFGNEFDGVANDGVVTLGEFRYEHGSDEIAYDGGAVVRASEGSDGTNSAMLEGPHLKYNNETKTAVISLVSIDADDRSIQSDENLGFTMNVDERSSAVADIDDGHNLTVELEGESRYKDAWEDELEDWEDVDAERVIITIAEVEIDR